MVARALGMTPDELRESFQPATARHLPSIIDLRSQFRSRSWDDERYLRWRYDFSERTGAGNKLMVVARGDRVLGMIGTESVRLVRSSKTLDAVSTMDILVDPALDGAGLGAWLNMAIFAGNPVVFAIGANPNSLGLVTRLFYMLPNRKPYIAPVRVGRRLARQFPYRIGRVVAPLVAAPADLGLSLWRSVSYRRLPQSWSLQDLTLFDESVDSLFARRWGAEDITFERSSNYLNWRLFENPRVRYSVLAAFEDGDMLGYAAYCTRDEDNGIRASRLVDWLVDARYGFTGFSMLAQEIIRRAVAERADIVSISPMHSRLEQSLWRLGFITRPSSEFATLGIRCAEPTPWPELRDGAEWCLTQANSDLD